MSGPENHSGLSRTIQISMPGVFQTKMLLIKVAQLKDEMNYDEYDGCYVAS